MTVANLGPILNDLRALVPYLGSDDPAEVIAAAREMGRLITAVDSTWADVATTLRLGIITAVDLGRAGPPPGRAPEIGHQLEALLGQYRSDLDPKELAGFERLHGFWKAGKSIATRQRIVIWKAYQRVVTEGVSR
jgi:hypothetical protein